MCVCVMCVFRDVTLWFRPSAVNFNSGELNSTSRSTVSFFCVPEQKISTGISVCVQDRCMFSRKTHGVQMSQRETELTGSDPWRPSLLRPVYVFWWACISAVVDVVLFSRASNNQKVKETVALELSFVNSNLQLLKEELEELNSTMNVYQTERFINITSHLCEYDHSWFSWLDWSCWCKRIFFLLQWDSKCSHDSSGVEGD